MIQTYHLNSNSSKRNIRDIRKNDVQLILIFSKQCGHCHVMMPEWERLEQSLKDNKYSFEKEGNKCCIVKVDADIIPMIKETDTVLHNKLLKILNHSNGGVPSIALDSNVSNEMIPYFGERTSPSMLDFVIKNSSKLNNKTLFRSKTLSKRRSINQDDDDDDDDGKMVKIESLDIMNKNEEIMKKLKKKKKQEEKDQDDKKLKKKKKQEEKKKKEEEKDQDDKKLKKKKKQEEKKKKQEKNKLIVEKIKQLEKQIDNLEAKL